MSNKRRRRRKANHFLCPHCQVRLWRCGGQKYRLYYEGVKQIQSALQISSKKASLISTRGLYVDQNTWIEEFFCGEHGQVWLLVSQKPDGSITYTEAKEKHWRQTIHTTDPTRPNPSVSDYTYRNSRGKLRYD